MTGFKFTYAPHRNQHMEGCTTAEASSIGLFLEDWVGQRHGRAYVCIEGVGGEHQHVHAYWETLGRYTTQKMQQFMDAEKGGLSKLRRDSKSWKLEIMPPSQTLNMSVGGYCQKEDSRVELLKLNISDEDMESGRVQYESAQVLSKTKLTENNIMDLTLQYREKHKIESTEMGDVLFEMIRKDFTFGYYIAKRGRLTQAMVEYFRTASQGFENSKALIEAVYPDKEVDRMYGTDPTGSLFERLQKVTTQGFGVGGPVNVHYGP